MYHTWFFLKRLAEELDEQLKDLQLLACFSQQKDELILSFGNANKEFHIKADLSSQAGILSFQESFARARKNSVDLFGELLDQRVTSVKSFMHERSFFISFENGHDLIFKMHGRRSNVLLSHADKVTKVFRNSLEQDLIIIPSELDNNVELDAPNIIRLVGRRFSYLIDNQLDNMDLLIDKSTRNECYLGVRNDLPVLSLVSISDPILVTSSAIEASNKYAQLHYRHFLFGEEKRGILNLVSKKVSQSESYIFKTKAKLSDLQEQRSLEEIANILMANLHRIPANERIVTLDDFYTNEQISIKLNPNLTPQKNAENYYRKNKNKKLEFDNLKSNIENKECELEKLKSDLIQLESIESLKELRAFKANYEKGAGKNDKAPLPYYHFDVEGWTILVGKNAKSNDVLTTKIASKNDLWLHARDVSGSHVVLREKPGSKFPTNIIEKAAALAAWYSKRKTDSLCPVIFTPRKFVRKIKGAPPGQVVVDKEEVVMIEPNNQI